METTNKINFSKYLASRKRISNSPKDQRLLIWYGAAFDPDFEKSANHKKSLLKILFRQ